MTEKFIIFSLPRSRTAWLSRFLSYGGKTCGHDLAVTSDGIEDLLFKIGGVDGTIETGAVIGQAIIRERFPKASIIVLRRREEEVLNSFKHLGVSVDENEIRRRAHLLDELSEVTGVHTIPYDSLKHEMCCAWLFTYCLRSAHNHAWWDTLRQINIQIDMEERLKLLIERQEIIHRMRVQCAA